MRGGGSSWRFATRDEGWRARCCRQAVEPFFSTKPSHLGVGLSIANGIWRRHRGTLSIRSQPGEGTAVRLCVVPPPGVMAGPSEAAHADGVADDFARRRRDPAGGREPGASTGSRTVTRVPGSTAGPISIVPPI